MDSAQTTAAFGGAVEGQHEHTVDGKGRVSIPSEFRIALGLVEGSELVVTRHLNERCLLIYWGEAWSNLKARIHDAPPKVANAIRRVVCGAARRVKLDRLGRIQIPQTFRSYAELEGKCFLMGQGSVIECWSMSVWDLTHGPEAYSEFDLSEFHL
ncbi:MAG: AbrB/MazE/SpoVT family DNA-binding domain-containing protein [Myxococcota bacterium]|nr:AbrB/MazE/SpoVT family DNA-binding domain-containing protein [Myxococcota bacterium]